MSGSSSGIGLSNFWQLAFQVSPVILSVGGLAAAFPGNLLPIVLLTESLGIAGGLLTGAGVPSSLDDFFCQFLPMPGATLIDNAIGQYPFANQSIAANAIIQQPLKISMQMIAPARQPGDLLTKLAIFTALQAALQAHIQNGGLFIVATPAQVYQNCILVGFTDVSPPGYKQWQIIWQLDFQQPLVTQAQAQTAYNSLLSQINGGTASSQGGGAWSGLASSLGFPVQGVSTQQTGLSLVGQALQYLGISL